MGGCQDIKTLQNQTGKLFKLLQTETFRENDISIIIYSSHVVPNLPLWKSMATNNCVSATNLLRSTEERISFRIDDRIKKNFGDNYTFNGEVM